jgi:transposase
VEDKETYQEKRWIELDEEDMKKLKGYLKKEQLYWTTKEVINLVKERFGVELKENRIREILKLNFVILQ